MMKKTLSFLFVIMCVVHVWAQDKVKPQIKVTQTQTDYELFVFDLNQDGISELYIASNTCTAQQQFSSCKLEIQQSSLDQSFTKTLFSKTLKQGERFKKLHVLDVENQKQLFVETYQNNQSPFHTSYRSNKEPNQIHLYRVK